MKPAELIEPNHQVSKYYFRWLRACHKAYDHRKDMVRSHDTKFAIYYLSTSLAVTNLFDPRRQAACTLQRLTHVAAGWRSIQNGGPRKLFM